MYEGGGEEAAPKAERTGLSKLWYNTGKFTKSWDEVAPTIRDTLHVDGDEDQKTHSGGFFTFLAKIYLLYVVYVSGYQMLYRKNSYILTQEANVPKGASQISKVKDMNQIHYAILDHNDRYYKLEETTQYIEINLIHTTYYYVNGVEKKAKKKYPVRNCEPKDFVDPDPGATEMSRYYQAEVVKKKQNFICLSDEALELKIEGNLQSRKAYNERNTFISFQIDWCKKNCASDDDIKAWLFNKQLEPLAFNRKPALATFGRISRPSFSQYPALPFEAGIKSDLWFRFEENTFKRKDRFYHSSSTKQNFYAIKLIYSNYITVPDNYADLKKNRIARMLYRNDEIMMNHEREVIQFEEFLGNVAGIYDLIMFFVVTLLGGYIDFNARVKWVKKFYRFTDANSGPEMDKKAQLASDSGRINLGNMSLPWHYMKHESIFGVLIRCVWKAGEVEELQNLVIETGSEKVDDDFNFIHYIKQKRLSNWESEKWELMNEINFNDYPGHYEILIHEQNEEEEVEEIKEAIGELMKQKFLSVVVGPAADQAPTERQRSATQLAKKLSVSKVQTSLQASSLQQEGASLKKGADEEKGDASDKVDPIIETEQQIDTERPLFDNNDGANLDQIKEGDIELQTKPKEEIIQLDAPNSSDKK